MVQGVPAQTTQQRAAGGPNSVGVGETRLDTQHTFRWPHAQSSLY